MSHRTGITLRLTPADRTALEALQAFTQEHTATRAIDIAVKRYPDTCRALENAEADRDQARRALQELLDALDEVDSAQSVNRKLKCPLFRILKCPLVDKEMAVSIILCISPYLATVPVSLQAHVPTTLPCASLSTGNSRP